MKVLYWNCRGIGNRPTQNTLYNFCTTHKPDLLCLAEPLVDLPSITDGFWRSLQLSLVTTNIRDHVIPSIWIFSSAAIQSFTIISMDSQQVSIKVEFQGQSHCFTFVYAHVLYARRRPLWAALSTLSSSIRLPWAVIGDFNSVMGAHEKTGPRITQIACTEFREAIDNANLLELDTKGTLYTWTNGSGRGNRDHIECRLDRAFTSSPCLDYWDSVTCTALPRHHSDHNPIILQLEKNMPTGPRPFRFMSMWTTHPTFKDLVSSIWSQPVCGPPLVRVTSKLKAVKSALKTWNKEVFGNMAINISKAKDHLQHIQLRISNEGFSDDLFAEEVTAHSTLDDLLKQQEMMLKDKSRVKWLTDGDRNTEFFHTYLCVRKSQRSISSMKISNVITSDRAAIKHHVLDFYQSLFSEQGSSNSIDYSIIDDVVPSMVTDVENSALVTIPSSDEVKAAVFSLDPSSSPGPDGFSGHFYQNCWDFISADIIEAVQSFFISGHLLPSINSNFMVLIPKSPDAISVDQYRPIVLGNFIFKVITKILAERLSHISCRIISPNQFGFIKGRHIEECIAVASEGINLLNKRTHGGNVAIKIDIRKAFDSLRWSFIIKVLSAFGFSSKLCGWITSIFSSARISVLINGSPEGYFACSRGVRQGDPLSPLLFGIAEDFLSRYLSKLVLDK